MISLKELKKMSKNLRVLYVEDDIKLQEMLKEYLQMIFNSLRSASDGEEGLKLFKESHFDLVITDIQMPNMSGFEMISAIKKLNPTQEVLITTAYSERSYFIQAIELEVSGYIIKPIDFTQMNQSLFHVVEKIIKYHENDIYKSHLEELVTIQSNKNSSLEKEKIKNYEETLLALVDMVERRDTYTAGHSRRVALYCKLIAKEMDYSTQDCNLIYRAGILHDIGKITTPDSILLKPDRLKPYEYDLIKEHALAGAQVLKQISMYHDLSNIIAAHHERYDGKGYPLGLKADEIPPLSQIMIIADSFDAMTTNRIYKPRMSHKEALKQIKELSGIQFDPKVTPYAIEALKGITIDTTINQQPNSALEKQRFAYFYIDQITALYNQNYLDLMLLQNRSEKKYTTITLLYLHNFTEYNNKFGWSMGDKLLKSVADILTLLYPESLIFRLHGDDFVFLSSKSISFDTHKILQMAPELTKGLRLNRDSFNIKALNIFSLTRLEELLQDI